MTAYGQFVFSLLLLISSVLGDDFSVINIHNLYKDIGCTPVLKDGSAIPARYDCSKFEKRDVTKCYDGAKEYAIDEKIDGVRPGSCLAECKCMNTDGKALFNCANVECPEHFGRRQPSTRLLYEDDKCCSVESSTATPETAKVTCSYNDQTYIGGEKFYPKDEDASCKVCICKAGFQGKIEEPFCKQIQCHAQLKDVDYLNRGCIPIYYKEKGCCPIEWRCPEDTDVVAAARTTSTDTCKFGKLTLNIGEELNPTSPNRKCSCQTPPYVTCLQVN